MADIERGWNTYFYHMNRLTLAVLSTLFLVACAKKDKPAPPDQYLTFSFTGDSAWTNIISVDTSWQWGYPQISIYGLAYLPGTGDEMALRLDIMDDVNKTGSVPSVTLFSGVYSSLQYTNPNRFVELQLDSQKTLDSFISMIQNNYHLTLTVDSIRGRTIWGTFYGTMAVTINDNNMPPTESVTNGKFKINMW
jgi:hypothetical protein